ncbi:MAG: TlpA disulfide reductase family protein [Gemmatimonadaceae bacterium]
MRLHFRHPTAAELGDYLSDSPDESRARIAAHLVECQRCRDNLQFVREVSSAASGVPTDEPSASVLDRVLASRASDTRLILPTADAAPRPKRHWALAAAAAILLAVLGGAIISQRASDVEAASANGILNFAPAAPRAGQAVDVDYQPPATLARQTRLELRARYRTRSNENYNAGIPTTVAAELKRGANGKFNGRVVLPDSVVYAVFAVEDTSATMIDDNAGRNWELLVSDSLGKPLFDALDQRANDMMGRNWEEGFATARRMTALYPNELRAWIWMKSFHSWLGRADDDSIRISHRARLAAFDSIFTSGPPPSKDDIGEMAWYAVGTDSSVAAAWRARLLRDAPNNSFAIQWRMFDGLDSLRIKKDTAAEFRRMDGLWASAPPSSREQVASYAAGLAIDAMDTTQTRRWTTRLVDAQRYKQDVRRWVATQLSRMPALRNDGIQQLRDEIDSLSTPVPSQRGLDETRSQQQKRNANAKRTLLATLGQALVARGDYAAARVALSEASSEGWNTGVFRAVQTANLAGGDTANALVMTARLAVDPRSTHAFNDSANTLGTRVLGAVRWKSYIDSARVEYVKRMLADAPARSLTGKHRVRNMDGRTFDLAGLTKGKVSVIVFWSRFCGPAIESLPAINDLSARLARSGVPVITVIDEANASSALSAFLREKNVAVPTYLDTWHEASQAFNQWGTPSYYVVDGDGRIRFNETNSADEALARAEAVRLAYSQQDGAMAEGRR